MAIIYTTGTISQPDAGSVGLAMVEKIRDDVVAHAAWDLVEEFTPGSGAVRWYVLKCLAASSGLASDFFVVMGRTLATGEIRFAICEGYNSGSHTMQFFSHFGTSGTQAFDASGRSAATFVLGTTVFPGSVATPKYQAWIPSGTSTKWWICVDSDGFTAAFNGAANGFVHIGAFTPISELSWPMPLQHIGSAAPTTTEGGLTRNPAIASAAAGFQGALSIQGGSGGVGSISGPMLGPLSDLRYNDKLQNNQRVVAEQGIITSSVPGQVDAATSIGWFCGKQKRMRIGASGSSPAGFAFGDAYALNGTLWVPFNPTDVRIWDTGVAAA